MSISKLLTMDMSMMLFSPDFVDQGQLPNKSVAAALGGKDIPPVLHFEGVPVDAKSLALTCYDPDAPTGSGFWHWIVVNIPVKASGKFDESVASSLTSATVVVNDASVTGFSGALPPPGDSAHRYVFSLHALSIDRIDANSMPQAYARFHIMTSEIGRATITARFANLGTLVET
jgi:Raf kinase inhibitor-like YbhB/YbcL family protein